MHDNSIEIRDDEINVEEIMDKIRENIRRRQAAGELPPDPDSVIGSPSKNCPAGKSDDAIQRDLSYINSNWDIHNNSYFISSHHPHIGKFLVKGRQLIHGEVRRYVDPMISRQTEFNASTVRIITQASQRYAELNQRQHELETAFSSFKRESDKKIADCTTTAKSELDSKIELTTKELITAKSELDSKIELTTKELITAKSELDSKIKLTIKELFTQMDVDIHARAWLAHVLEDRVQKGLAQKSAPLASSSKENTNYFLFEERFRGSREDITQRQLAFLPYFEKCSRVLDIGCGRGEFLEILKDHDIGGIGVDSDPDMVAYCRSRQLKVEHSDAIAYLVTLEDKSLDGIFIDQVVEHLEPDYLVRLLALSNQKMKFGYHIAVETVNPLSFVSFVNFYIDMTHKRPVHPETLQYLFSASGFRECEKKFFSPVSDEGRLKKIEGTADMNAAERKNVDVYNYNIEMLNIVLFGAQDYAVVGKK
jgi:O-antigen chain-terminating methyltransferase